MKKKILASLTVLIQSLILLAGAPLMARAESSPIRVDIEPTRYMTVSKAFAVQEENRIKISGVLTRPSIVHLTGHIDLIVLGPDRSLVEKKRIRVTDLRSKLKRRMDIPFGTVLDAGIPAGSQVILRYHTSGDSEGRC